MAKKVLTVPFGLPERGQTLIFCAALRLRTSVRGAEKDASGRPGWSAWSPALAIKASAWRVPKWQLTPRGCAEGIWKA